MQPRCTVNFCILLCTTVSRSSRNLLLGCTSCASLPTYILYKLQIQCTDECTNSIRCKCIHAVYVQCTKFTVVIVHPWVDLKCTLSLQPAVHLYWTMLERSPLHLRFTPYLTLLFTYIVLFWVNKPYTLHVYTAPFSARAVYTVRALCTV